jgi:divalent metal cation (Fe/Co/Zn/Cd) transporter
MTSHAAPAARVPALAHGSPAWRHAAGQAKRLSWLSLAYMAVEGAVAITAAVLAGSVALLGFGLDSVIESLASIIIVWRFADARRMSETAERTAQKAVAVSFFLLAPYVAADAPSP